MLNRLLGVLREINTLHGSSLLSLGYLMVEQVSTSSKALLFIVSGIAQVVKMPATNHSPGTRNKQRKGEGNNENV